ncbi:hypothetical protein CBR_g41407 [Chara braunii]|uniref:Ribosomal RNA-processing protein 43 n=1 Tax=Chara braunii TaxID=69332 RepID=A0A388LVX5_CHABU|nr:hypothetical protein CBR_g41407 [Chara braunii]|eukprot:GBG86411.1 hypothetical protein CBR_g41407 [Chara braunii]
MKGGGESVGGSSSVGIGSPTSSVEMMMESTAGADQPFADVEQAVADVYSRENFARFLEDGLRPDGRPLGRARRTSIGLGSIATAEGSSLVKIGNTTMLAGVKLEVAEPSPSQPDEGFLGSPSVSENALRAVQYDSMGKGEEGGGGPGGGRGRGGGWVEEEEEDGWGGGRREEEGEGEGRRRGRGMGGGEGCREDAGGVNKKELCIIPRKAVWKAFLDVYCLDADGSLFDAALLAAVSALSDGIVDEDGTVCFRKTSNGNDSQCSRLPNRKAAGSQSRAENLTKVGIFSSSDSSPPMSKSEMSSYVLGNRGACISPTRDHIWTVGDTLQADEWEGGRSSYQRTLESKRLLSLGAVPFALSLAIFGRRHGSRNQSAADSAVATAAANIANICADPCRAEEELADAIVTVALDQHGQLVSMFKAGGLSISTAIIQDCIEATKLRVKKLRSLLCKAVDKGATSDAQEPVKMEEM